MKISFHQKIAAVAIVAIISILSVTLTGKPSQSTPAPHAAQTAQPSATNFSTDEKEKNTVLPPPAVAPFIVRDTDDDSPGTNIVTRIVTFSATIGGTPPPQLQWKVDRGAGFVAVAGAVKNVLRIGNAQVSDSGFYALFATNSAGSLQTTPQQLVVTEGED